MSHIQSPPRLVSTSVTIIFGAVLLLLFQAETIQAQWTTNGNNINNTNSGNVGIGTTSPDKKLTVQGTIPSPGGAMTVLRTTGANNGYGLLLDATGTGNNNLGFSVNGAAKGGSAWDIPRSFLGFVNLGYSNNDFSLRLNSDGSLTYHDSVYPGPERFRITAAGNVGIATLRHSRRGSRFRAARLGSWRSWRGEAVGCDDRQSASQSRRHAWTHSGRRSASNQRQGRNG